MTTLTSADLAQIEFELRQFTGSEQFFRHSLVRSVVYTEGVQYVAEKFNAYWLIDIIASWQPKLRDRDFQVWTLEVDTDKSTAVVTCQDDDKATLVTQKIEFTDFPLKSMVFWVIIDDQTTILLPSEY